MGGKGRFDGEIDLPGGSFSRLLLSPEADDTMFPSPSPSPLFSANTPKMLCFGDFSSDTSQHHSTTPRKPTLFNSSLSTKRRNGSGQEPELRSENNNNNGGATTATGLQTKRNERKKKNKPEMGPTPTPTPTATRTNSSAVHAKKRREKLGERITALQQLVSPYGKTDTASVLHEAMGYIRFLQDQVKVLSSPYLDCLPSSCPPHHLSENEGEKCREEATKGLRSKGLCLVPVQCLVDINDSNGADFWASAPSATPFKP